MSCTVLKKKGVEAPSILHDLTRDAGAIWERVTNAIHINRSGKDDFRIPDPPQPKKSKSGGGVGYCYKKSGTIRK
jgi:hypothetical protein